MATKEKSTIITAFVFDFETGGLDCTKAAATQISIHAVRLDNFEMMDTLNLYISPYVQKENLGKPAKKVLKSKFEEEAEPQLMEYSQVALDYSAITMDMLYSMGEPIEVVCDKILDFIKKNTFNVGRSSQPILVGQNVLFDIGFLQQIFIYTGKWNELTKIIRGHKDFWGNFVPYYIDTILLCQLAFNNDRSINSYKLELEAERLGIELDDAHDADADVLATQEVLRVLTGRLRSSGDASGEVGMVEVKKEKLRDYFKI